MVKLKIHLQTINDLDIGNLLLSQSISLSGISFVQLVNLTSDLI